MMGFYSILACKCKGIQVTQARVNVCLKLPFNGGQCLPTIHKQESVFQVILKSQCLPSYLQTRVHVCQAILLLNQGLMSAKLSSSTRIHVCQAIKRANVSQAIPKRRANVCRASQCLPNNLKQESMSAKLFSSMRIHICQAVKQVNVSQAIPKAREPISAKRVNLCQLTSSISQCPPS